MNCVERVKRTFDFEEVDRPPVWDWLRNDEIIEYFAGESLSAENGRGATIKAYACAVDVTKQEMRFPAEEGEYINADGHKVIQKRWTEWFEHDSENWSQENILSAIKSKIRDYSWSANDDSDMAMYVNQYQELQTGTAPTMIFPCDEVGLTNAYKFCGGIQTFSYFLYDHPKIIKEYLELNFNKAMDRIAHLPEDFRPFCVFLGEDIAFKTGLLFSSGFLAENFLPYLKKIVEAYHSIGTKVLFHSDGNCWRIMDELVDAGIDGFNPIEPVSGMTVAELRKKYPKLVLVGGVDVSQLMAHGTPDECYKQTRENIESSPRGYIVGGSAEIHNAVKLENYLAMLKGAWEGSCDNFTL